MIREIQIPEEIIKVRPSQLEISVSNNDDVLLSFCAKKMPRYGVITNYGIQWNSYEDFQKDAEEICHEFYQFLVFYQDGKVIAPAHADEIYNQKINPYTFEPLN
jgi:hypothetical protein